jgi:hypothetical protein
MLKDVGFRDQCILRRKLIYSSLALRSTAHFPCKLTPIPLRPNDRLCLSSLGSGLVGVDLLSVLVVSDSWRGCSVAATFTGTNTVRELSALLFSGEEGCSTKVHLSA